MQLVDNMLGRNPNSRDEQLGATFDDNIHKLVQGAFGIVHLLRVRQGILEIVRNCHTLVLRALPPTCGINKSTPNGKDGSFKPAYMEEASCQSVRPSGAKRVSSSKGVSNTDLQLINDVLQHLWRISDATDHAQPTYNSVQLCCMPVKSKSEAFPHTRVRHSSCERST
jgi:hypothetical protein